MLDIPPRHLDARDYERADALHWLEPGLTDVDCVHWLPYLTAQELGLDRSKLVLDVDLIRKGANEA